MTAVVIQGDARHLPLPDASVDLIVTSPPYWVQRDYGYIGQLGSEATPAEWLANLIDCTRDWMRVLKPSGSMFVNLGDKYAQRDGQGPMGHRGGTIAAARSDYHGNATATGGRAWDNGGIPAKSLLGLPWRYALACTDQLGLILRRDIIWAKPNGLPESVTDRCRSSHEYLFHLVRQPRYYAAVDEIREPHVATQTGRNTNGWAHGTSGNREIGRGQWSDATVRDFATSPLGKLPGSVWTIPSQPLTVPAALGVDHFAAFPMELPRRCILGWSPPGVCVECGEGRRPVAQVGDIHQRVPRVNWVTAMTKAHGPDGRDGRRVQSVATITGYACACTPHTDHPGTGSSGEGYNRPGEGIDAGRRITFPDTPGPPSRLSTRPHVGGGREYHFDGWTPPTRPAIVLDPFGGTGTTALVASVHGRHGVSIDRSADYTRLARWRTTDPGERAKALQVPKPPPVTDGQDALFAL